MQHESPGINPLFLPRWIVLCYTVNQFVAPVIRNFSISQALVYLAFLPFTFLLVLGFFYDAKYILRRVKINKAWRFFFSYVITEWKVHFVGWDPWNFYLRFPILLKHTLSSLSRRFLIDVIFEKYFCFEF